MKMIICKHCGEWKEHQAHGLCGKCYLVEWNKLHPEKQNEYNNKRNQKESRKRYQKEYSRKWYIQNREKRLEQAKALYNKNKSAIKIRQSKWNKNNRESKRQSWKNWFNRKRTNGGSLSVSEWEDIKRKYDYRCAYCKNKISPLTQDHVIPLSKGGKHDKSNVVPACKPCNSSKGNRIIP